jgi:uncharacterized membrane protein YhfC
MTGVGVVVRVLSAGLMIGLPVLAAYWVLRAFRGVRPRLLLWGVGSFAFSQLLHLPFNTLVLMPGLERFIPAGWEGRAGLVLTGLALGLSAGIFEECSRWLAFRLWAPEERRWSSAVALGVGHGGLEAGLVGLLVLFALVQAAALENPAALEALGPEQAQLAAEQLGAYWETPAGVVLLGALERFSALLFHLGASVLVLQVFVRGSLGWLGAAVLAHTALNAAAVYGVQQWGVVPTEAVLLALGGATAALGWKLRPRERGEDGGQPPGVEGAAPRAQAEVSAGEVSDEQLERSRYQ